MYLFSTAISMPPHTKTCQGFTSTLHPSQITTSTNGHYINRIWSFFIILLQYIPALASANDVFVEIVDDSSHDLNHKGSGYVLVIPDEIDGVPVTYIERDSYYGQTNIIGIVFPESLQEVRPFAFYGCTGLTNINLPSNLQTIQTCAFADCSNLTNINVAPGNVYLASSNGVLYNADFSQIILYPAGKEGGFDLPASVSSIYNGAFHGASKLSHMDFNDQLREIGIWGFKGCSMLSNISLPASIESLGHGVFASCTALTNFYVNNSNMYYSSCDGILFSKDTNTLIQFPAGMGPSYQIPERVTNIFQRAFEGCTTLKSIAIPAVHAIGNSAFLNCVALTNVFLADGIVSIGGYSFGGCSALCDIVVPASIQSIPWGAFNDCSNLSNIVLHEGLLSIGPVAFENCGIRNIHIPASVASIDWGAFVLCNNLTNISVSLDNPFYTSCDGVLLSKDKKTLTHYAPGKKGAYAVPNGVETIWKYAFLRCSNLTSVILPASVQTLESYSFNYCANLVGICCEGSPPTPGAQLFVFSDKTTVFYRNGAAGWEGVFAGRPTAIWPEISETTAISNTITFRIIASTGQSFIVERCDNLIEPIWHQILTNTVAEGSFDFFDAIPPATDSLYYRLALP